MDRMIYDGREYELAKMTMKIARLIDKTEKSSRMIDAYNGELEVVRASLGDETAKELLETLNIEEMELTTLVLVYNAVTAGYEARIETARREREAEILQSPSVKAVADMASNVKILKSIDER